MPFMAHWKLRDEPIGGGDEEAHGLVGVGIS